LRGQLAVDRQPAEAHPKGGGSLTMWQIRPLRGLALGLVLIGTGPGIVQARELQPLMRGWEQHFSVTWDTAQRHGRLEVEGYVNNRSPYRVGNLRVLVDSLDGAGRTVDQRVSWVLGELGGDSRLFFEVPVTPAAQYRVRVFSYDRIDEAGVTLP
jgi:hypothetical protein